MLKTATRVLQFALVAKLAVLLVACASSGTTVHEASLSQLTPGKTTERDIETAFGPPQFEQTAPDGSRTLMYIGTHMHLKATSLVPIVGLFAGGAKVQGSHVVFRFAPDGTLIDHQSGASQQDVRTGLVAGAQ